MGPLRGVTVLELAHIMAGPVCGRMLADLGADVIKVEPVPGGDPARKFLPPAIKDQSAAFLMMNRNKRGIAVDLKSDGGQHVVKRLVERADVLVENYRRGTMERFGLGYDALKRLNPSLIYCEISGFGRTGPYADRGGFDLIAQGFSGLMAVTGEGPNRPPVKCGPPLTDITAGILAAMGILAAYVHRLQTGEGQRVDTSLFEAGITHTYWQSAIALATGVSPGPMGSAHPLSAPYQAFQTADGWMTVGASSQATWERLPDVVELPNLKSDRRFADNAGRMAHRDALVSILAARLRERPTQEWLSRFEAAGIPAGPVLSIGEMLEHPQTISREMVTSVPHTTLGEVTTLGFPVRLDRTPGRVTRGAPLLGEHTRDVLRTADYSDAEVDDLVDAGAVIVSPDRG